MFLGGGFDAVVGEREDVETLVLIRTVGVDVEALGRVVVAGMVLTGHVGQVQELMNC